ncbi:MAG: TIGR03032 family protein [Pseudomonadota bacterium]
MQENNSADMAVWLKQHAVSLAFSTYRANRLMFLGRSDTDQLKLHERLFDRPMGLYVYDAGGVNSLWMASRTQLWRFDNMLETGQRFEGADRLYVPALSYTTGDVNGHEIVLTPDGQPLFVNTAFSCLATVKPGCSFFPTWQPPFISRLSADDRCHLNGLAMVDGVPTWATACGHGDAPTGWRDHRSGGGVMLHIPSNSIVATGLSMPHSPRWHQGKLWLLNSGTGELGFIEDGRFVALCFLPGFARGLAFVGNTAVVGLSKLRSPQFTGLPLETRLQAGGTPVGCCGLRVIDLSTGAILHSLDLPEPIDELFDVVVLPGVRQPKALGLQGEDIQCLVKLPDQAQLVTVRPKAPSGKPHQGDTPPLFGLPDASTAVRVDKSGGAVPKTPAEPVAIAASAIRYQQVFQLTPQTLAPYAGLTFPSLAPGSARLAAITGELLGLSAMADGVMVGLAIAERQADGRAVLVSLQVEPHLRRQGIATRLMLNLQRFMAQQGASALAVQYRAGKVAAVFEPLLQKLGWTPPRSNFLMLQSSAERLASTGWGQRYALKPSYELFGWLQHATQGDLVQSRSLGAPEFLLPSPSAEGLEPAVCLGLRHQGVLVGWLLAQRLNAGTVRYASLYVAPAHRSRGQALALLAEAFARQHAAGIPQARAAIPVASIDDFKNTGLLRLFKRHLQPYLLAVGESRSATLVLPVSQPPAA